MSMLIAVGVQGPVAAVFQPVGRGRSYTFAGGSMSMQLLPTDPIGSTLVTFQGINADSEIRVYLSDGSEIAGVENSVANQALSWDVYSPGSANNTVRIVVIHPAYKIKEFTYTAAIGAASLPMQQELDKWYSNPT